MALAQHQHVRSRTILAFGPSANDIKGFAHVKLDFIGRVRKLLEWLPLSEFSHGVTFVETRVAASLRTRATFKLKTREWTIHYSNIVTNPQKILQFFNEWIPEPLRKARAEEKIPPKLKSAQVESMVYGYIVDHGGQINIERCAKELELPKCDVEKAIKALKLKKALERKPPKLTPVEAMVYGYIVDHRGEISIKECAKEFKLSKSKVERAVKSLAAKGKLEAE